MEKGVLKTPNIIDAFRAVDRKDFLPRGREAALRGVSPIPDDLAYEDHPLDIGWGQTISQPYTVAFMLELLQPEEGSVVLDVGHGSGWTTTLLARIAKRVYAIERVPELCAFGRENVEKYKELASRVVFLCQDATVNLPEVQFDRILVGAAARNKVPETWKDHLKAGGRMVLPIQNSIWLFIKKGDNTFEEHEHQGFVFVPLVRQ